MDLKDSKKFDSVDFKELFEDILPFNGPTGLVKSVSHFIVIAESIKTGILQQSFGFLVALNIIQS